MSGPDGFGPGPVEAPIPLVEVSEETRECMVRVLMAVSMRVTPEDAIEAVRCGQWPSSLTDRLALPLQADVMHAYVDVLLVALQSPAPVPG
jgi:hypothetical protein